ncbi:MAG: diacylglycerol kinase, partial [Microbacteriaceae bacterium]|nr:diacylglycerol kinase [Microbacteriaceae bacterium]
MAGHLIVAVNPTAAAGRNAEVGDRVVERARAAGHDVVRLEANDAATLERHLRARLERRRADAVVVVGGDGMVHLAVNALARTGVALGVVPTGTGNDFSRHLGLPQD